MVELLAPAGDFNSLKAAVLNGANAVYLGGKEFSARQYAGNFDREEMIEAVKFCHSYNVKVFVTLNTLLDNLELKAALEYAAFLYEIGVDALIIQDIGLLKILKENIPEFELHGSTQMTAHNLEAVNLLHSMGLKRVVLSRELSLKEIEYISKNTKAELEVFVHGALCIGFSGQCLMSSIIGGRSGNRGRCAQPCRMEYSIDDNKKQHYLSPKDLSTLEYIEEIKKTGVYSLKIEGRMKRPEYVATVVSSYRRALDNMSKKDDIDRVTQVFNRGGFTSAFLFTPQGREMMSYERPKHWGVYLGKVIGCKEKFADIKLEKSLKVGDGVEIFGKNIGAPISSIKINGRNVESAKPGDIINIYLEGASKGDRIYKTLDAELYKEAEESFKGKDIKRIPIWGSFKAKSGEIIEFTVFNQDGITSIATAEEPEIALKTPTTCERVAEALNKTKDTSFYFEGIEIEMDDNLAIPVSKLNLLRREAIEGLLEKLQGKREKINVNIDFSKTKKSVIPKIAVKTGSLEIAESCIDAGCDVVFLGGDLLRKNKEDFNEFPRFIKENKKVYPWYPEIILEEFETLKKQAIELKEKGIDKALCGNMGMYSFLRGIGFDVYLDSGFNLFNSKSCETFKNSGCHLSPELTIKQLSNVISNTESKTMVLAHGRIKLMTSRHCFVGSSMGHGKKDCPVLCKNQVHYLRDRMGEVFPVYTDVNCRSHIYNSKILCTIEHIKDIIKLNADFLVLNLLDEEKDEAALVVKAYREGIERAFNNEFKIGSYGEELLEELKGNITKGHLYRGVL
ncbi:peptidase U32 [Fervidicella metallireducens AeB]|uniref:Peptidase U32 n=1 Tax=Fervidicella metallireducens AeB TaxID=1403537 RepID=A0A017RZU8_9CLOT|nr:DUF3656 domain-containing protein [Fervidicella metallireducens]EYE89455.1 peptidase U32 [Fervidicella metallireducens AeB]